MKSIRGFLAALFAACAFLSVNASAGPIAVGPWFEFGFGAAGTALTSGVGTVPGVNPPTTFLDNPPWTFTCTTSCWLVVTDAFLSGDRFQFFDNLASIGLTSVPVLGSDCGNNVLGCLGNAAFSHGLFALTAGAHSITGIVTVSPFGAGAAFL